MTTNLIPLSPVDRVFVGAEAYPVEFLLRFDTLPSDAELQSALQRTIAMFPLLNAVLDLDGARPQFTLTTRTPQLSIDYVAARFKDTTKEDLYKLIDPVVTVPGEPLLRARVTRFTDATWLALSISHAVADGFSFFYFLSTWAAHCRGDKTMAPSWDRSFLAELDDPASVSGLTDPKSVFTRSGFALSHPRRHRRDEVVWRSELIEFEHLQRVKELGRQGASATALSSNDFVCAALLRRLALDSGIHQFGMAFDFRGLLPGVPRNYLGNAVIGAHFEVPLDTLRTMPLTTLAQMIRSRLSSIDASSVESQLTALAQTLDEGDETTSERFHVCDPEVGVFVTNMSKLSGATLDFGTGQPQRIELMSPAQGVYALISHPEGLELQYCLERNGHRPIPTSDTQLISPSLT